MKKKITIAIDAMGGDNSPKKTIQGVFLFLKKNTKNDDFILKLYGDEKKINSELSNYKISTKKIEIINTDSVVADETPLTAIKNSRTQACGINSQINGNSDISLSVVTLEFFSLFQNDLKMMSEVTTSFAGLWPNKNMNVVLDLGANIECNDENLVDFAEMGSALYKSLYLKETPVVSLLNVGSEEIKGTESLKKAFKKLKDLSNNNNFIFNGYIEGNKIMEGNSNVIVTDGFTGNVALKTAEGTAKFITDNLKKSLTKNLFLKISLLFAYFSLKRFKKKLDPSKYNGAIFLGLNGPVVKSHGGTDALGFYYSIDLCYKIVKGNLMSQIKNNLSHLTSVKK